jgi:deazaflavin-dependent oxidoreductase (nitroreductase family)
MPTCPAGPEGPAGDGRTDLPGRTTTGRRSGRPRTNPLTYARDGGDYVVVGSNYGKAHHPAWSANLIAEPRATIHIQGRELPVEAELVTDQDERQRLWTLMTRVWPAYDAYARRSGRQIRIFRLRPRHPDSAVPAHPQHAHKDSQ